MGHGTGILLPRHDSDPGPQQLYPRSLGHGVARFACDIRVDGPEPPYCSRTVLRRAAGSLGAAGYTLMAGVEAEHFLVQRKADGSIAPFDPDGVDTMKKPCYDSKSLSANMPYLRTLIRYMGRAELGALCFRPRGRKWAI